MVVEEEGIMIGLRGGRARGDGGIGGDGGGGGFEEEVGVVVIE